MAGNDSCQVGIMESHVCVCVGGEMVTMLDVQVVAGVALGPVVLTVPPLSLSNQLSC